MVYLLKFSRTSFLLLFLLFYNGVFCQNRDFTPIINELKNGFNIENQEVIQEDDEYIFKKSSIIIPNTDYIFYINPKDVEIISLVVAFESANPPSNSQIISELKSSSRVDLIEVKNDYDLDSYLIKERGKIIGVLEVSTDAEVKLFQFYRLPIAEIQEDIQAMADIVKSTDLVNKYRGERQGDESSSYYSSSFKSSGKETFFAKKGELDILYSSYEYIKPYIWVYVEDEFIKNNGFKDVRLFDEGKNGNYRAFFAVKDGITYVIDVWNNQSIGVSAVKKSIPNGMVEDKTAYKYLKSSKDYWTDWALEMTGEMKSIMEKTIDIADSQELVDMNSAQSYMSNVKPRITAFFGLMENISKDVDMAKSAAQERKCADTERYISRLKDELNKVNTKLYSFRTSTDNFINTNTEYASKGNQMKNDFESVLKSLEILNGWYNKMELMLPACHVPKDFKSKVEPLRNEKGEIVYNRNHPSIYTSDTEVEVEKDPYAAPSNFASHSGEYEGDALGGLIGRHIEDPAIQGFIKYTKSVGSYEDGDSFFSYEGNDVSLDFYKKKLVSITLGKRYKWPYNTPKDSVSKISQSSLPYEESFSPYVSAVKNGVEYMLYFDEETKKVTEFVIKKE